MIVKIFSSPPWGLFYWGNISNKFFSEFRLITSTLKCCLIFFSIFYLFISDVTAQNFFPLEVGNAYQLKNSWFIYVGSQGASGTDYYELRVISDTLVNNETYYSFKNNWSQYTPFHTDCIFRYDSLSQKLFIRIPNDTTTRLAVDFNTLPDSEYTSFILSTPKNFISQGTAFKEVMGDTFLVYSMKHPMGGGDFEYTYEFAANIGISKHKFYIISQGYEHSSTHNLLGAIVDSIGYNPLVLSVDSLYPVSDRPIDTFPYLLTIPYTASYSALVDSFYLDVEHFRSDTLVQTIIFSLPNSNPSHLTFYLDSLKVGDKIKLRATITDTSIYNNIDHYPDTGWVVMNVLPPIVNVENGNIPLQFDLAQNYPNPFNPITKISFQIPEQQFVTIKIFDVLGNELAILVQEDKSAGEYELTWNAENFTSGIYYYRITAGDFIQTKKMILLK